MLPVPYVLTVGHDDFIAITVPVSTKFVPTNLDLRVAWSPNLVDWFESQVWLETREFNPVDCLDYRVYRSRFPISGATPLGFLRLEVAP